LGTSRHSPKTWIIIAIFKSFKCYTKL